MLLSNKPVVLSAHGAGCACCSGARSVARPALANARRVRRAPGQLAPSVRTAAGNGVTTVVDTPVAEAAVAPRRRLAERHGEVLQHFPSAMGVDDFIGRVEIALAGFGFTGDNTIAMTNLCRDEVTAVLKDKIETIFGASFNTNGLGAVLTCGVTGMKAGLSHSPMCNVGRERYVFFAFPHIAINSDGEMGAISRPGRPKQSCACGALLAILGDLKANGVENSCKVPGVHDPLEPELTILKQRLARRVRYEKLSVDQLDLPGLTQVAERTISDDLEYLIEKAVDPTKSDYAVITGVQIHNWAVELSEGCDVSLEFVAPAKCYTVVNGIKTFIDLPQVPAMSPRQLQIMAAKSFGLPVHTIEPGMRGSTLSEVPLEYLVKKLGGGNLVSDGSDYAPSFANPLDWPTWQARIRLDNSPNRMMGMERDQLAPTMDSPEPVHPSFQVPAN